MQKDLTRAAKSRRYAGLLELRETTGAPSKNFAPQAACSREAMKSIFERSRAEALLHITMWLTRLPARPLLVACEERESRCEKLGAATRRTGAGSGRARRRPSACRVRDSRSLLIDLLASRSQLNAARLLAQMGSGLQWCCSTPVFFAPRLPAASRLPFIFFFFLALLSFGRLASAASTVPCFGRK